MRFLQGILILLFACITGSQLWNGSNGKAVASKEVPVQEIIPFEDESTDGYHFLDAVLLPHQTTTRPTNTVRVPVRPHFSDCSFQDFFKNQWHRYSVRETEVLKSFLKVITYDVNSSHYSFPCRYHVLALREIII